jgi:hypothetical protein
MTRQDKTDKMRQHMKQQSDAKTVLFLEDNHKTKQQSR